MHCGVTLLSNAKRLVTRTIHHGFYTCFQCVFVHVQLYVSQPLQQASMSHESMSNSYLVMEIYLVIVLVSFAPIVLVII